MTDGFEPLDELIQQHLDGILDEAGQKQLAQCLAESAEARALLASHMRLSGGMLQLAKAGCIGRKTETGDRFAPAPMNRSVIGRLRPWMAAAAALVAVAIGISLYSPARERPVFAVLEEVSAQGVFIERNGQRLAAASQMQLRVGDKLTTASEAGLVVRYHQEQTQVVLHGDTEVTFDEVEGAKRIDLADGLLLCNVAPQPDGRPMVLRTAGALAEVLGTRFFIGVEGEQTEVAVDEGRVRLIDAKRPSQSVEASGGESIRADATGVKKKATEVSSDDRNVVHGFELFEASTEKIIPGFSMIQDGAVINLAALPTRKLNIRVLTPSSVDGVWIMIETHDQDGHAIDPRIKPYPGIRRDRRQGVLMIQSILPYLVAGDDDRGPKPVPNAWTPPVGRYRITATPYLGTKKKPSMGQPVAVNFEVVDRP